MQQLACLRPHHRHHRLARGHIGDDHGAAVQMAAHPCFIGQACYGGRYHHKGGFAEPGDRDIRFNTPCVIEKLRIYNFFNWNR